MCLTTFETIIDYTKTFIVLPTGKINKLNRVTSTYPEQVILWRQCKLFSFVEYHINLRKNFQ
jgi:hypothetical protein